MLDVKGLLRKPAKTTAPSGRDEAPAGGGSGNGGRATDFGQRVSLAGAFGPGIMISSLVSKGVPHVGDAHEPVPRRCQHDLGDGIPSLLFLFRCDKVDMVGPRQLEQDGQLAEMTCYDPASCPKYAYNPCAGRPQLHDPLPGRLHQTARPERYDSGKDSSSPTRPTRSRATRTASARTRPGRRASAHPSAANVYAYLVLFFCIRVVGTIAAVQFTLIMMNSREMKPLAMGSISFLFGLLGVITPPPESSFDTVCIVENPSSSGRSFCLFYDTDRFRQLVHGIGGCFQPQPLPVEKDEVTRQKLRRAQKAAEAGGGTGEELQRLPTSGSDRQPAPHSFQPHQTSQGGQQLGPQQLGCAFRAAASGGQLAGCRFLPRPWRRPAPARRPAASSPSATRGPSRTQAARWPAVPPFRLPVVQPDEALGDSGDSAASGLASAFVALAGRLPTSLRRDVGPRLLLANVLRQRSSASNSKHTSVPSPDSTRASSLSRRGASPAASDQTERTPSGTAAPTVQGRAAQTALRHACGHLGIRNC
uniref:G_PROTEIN_RECEP_F3_4 domain-containing protein n=1 Tax=Macrostomum lignano TaxID=282301 RepID=A0A1I8F868_9PLAT